MIFALLLLGSSCFYSYQFTYGQNDANIGLNLSPGDFFTYTNYACGISINYLEDWEKYETSDNYRSKSDSDVIVYFYPPEWVTAVNETEKSNFSGVSVEVKDVFSTNTLRGYTIRNIDSYGTLPKFSLIQSNDTYMGDYPAHMIIFKDSSDLKSKQNETYKEMAIWSLENNKIYEIRYSDSSSERFDKVFPIIQTMIDSVILSTPGEYFSDDYSIRC